MLGLVLAAFAAAFERRWGIAVVCVTLAALTRETAVLAAMALPLTPGAPRRVRLALFAIPVAALGAWTLWLFHLFGASTAEGFSRNVGMPLSGWMHHRSGWSAPVLAIGEGALGVLAAVRARGAPHARAFAVLTLMLLVCLSDEVTISWINTSRVSAALVVLSAWASGRTQPATA